MWRKSICLIWSTVCELNLQVEWWQDLICCCGLFQRVLEQIWFRNTEVRSKGWMSPLCSFIFFPMQYNYPLIWSNPSARKKLLVRGNKFKTMYRTVRSEAPYQLQRLMTTAWMKMFCYIAKFNRQSAYLLYNRRKQEVSITADPETHSIWDDRR